MGTDPRAVGARAPGERPATPRLGMVPKEHGASFMSVHSLLLGVVAGFAAGGDDWTGLALALAFGGLFLPLTAAVSVITQPRLAVAARRRAMVLGAAFVLVGVLALVHGPRPQLAALGLAAVALGGSYVLARTTTGARSIPTQLAAIAGIGLLAPLAWLFIAGVTDLWPLSAVAAFLAFGGTVPYVRERVRRRRFAEMSLGQRLRGGAVALAWQVVALAGATALAVGATVSWLVPLAFIPGALKTTVALVRPETKPPIKKIGYLETAISTAFAVLAGIGLGISA